MKKLNLTVDGNELILLVPPQLPERTGRDTDMALWLISPVGEKAEAWLENTRAEQYAEEAKAVLLLLPGVEEDSFYTGKVWAEVHGALPRLSEARKDHRLVGFGSSGERCLRMVFQYPDKFLTAVAAAPRSEDGMASLKAAADSWFHDRSGEMTQPHVAISDVPEGEADAFADVLRQHGMEIHSHPDRPFDGWPLADQELKNTLAHM